MIKNAKYIVLAVIDGVTKSFEFTAQQKAEAIETYREVKVKASGTKFFSIDSEDEEIWYDLSTKY